MILVLAALGSFAATLVGGLTALRLRDRLHLFLGFSAGAVIGVAFFDLMPEAASFASKVHTASTVSGFVCLGFLFYLVLDRLTLLHNADAHAAGSEVIGRRSLLSAGSLVLHSFLDGIAIGLAFQVTVAAGAVVAIGVLTHDFADGVNIMNLVLKNGGDRRRAFRWLLCDAAAPVAGVIATLFFVLPEPIFGLALAFFAGLFLYIGASELIPESFHAHPKFLTTTMTLLGAAAIYTAVHLGG